MLQTFVDYLTRDRYLVETAATYESAREKGGVTVFQPTSVGKFPGGRFAPNGDCSLKLAIPQWVT